MDGSHTNQQCHQDTPVPSSDSCSNDQITTQILCPESQDHPIPNKELIVYSRKKKSLGEVESQALLKQNQESELNSSTNSSGNTKSTSIVMSLLMMGKGSDHVQSIQSPTLYPIKAYHRKCKPW